jgi:hypothetical protein
MSFHHAADRRVEAGDREREQDENEGEVWARDARKREQQRRGRKSPEGREQDHVVLAADPVGKRSECWLKKHVDNQDDGHHALAGRQFRPFAPPSLMHGPVQLSRTN